MNKRMYGWLLLGMLLTIFNHIGSSSSLAQSRDKSAPDKAFVSRIRNNGTGKCMNVYGGSQNNGADIIQWPCNNDANEQFDFVYDGGTHNGYDTFQIKTYSGQIGKCLDIYNDSDAVGARIVQWGCHSGNNQRWIFKYKGSSYSIVSVKSNLCLQPSQGSSADAIRILQVSCNNWENKPTLLWQDY
ncbi:MAG: RICIN domain-containing protein [Chloroflexi bacterium]|nr:RICIN domain-containing protein [Chloroflexota bacterium]